jgi:hypothetical protein
VKGVDPSRFEAPRSGWSGFLDLLLLDRQAGEHGSRFFYVVFVLHIWGRELEAEGSTEVKRAHLGYLAEMVYVVGAYLYFYSVSAVFLLDNVNEITAREVFDITTKTGCLVQKLLQMRAFLVNRFT